MYFENGIDIWSSEDFRGLLRSPVRDFTLLALIVVIVSNIVVPIPTSLQNVATRAIRIQSSVLEIPLHVELLKLSIAHGYRQQQIYSKAANFFFGAGGLDCHGVPELSNFSTVFACCEFCSHSPDILHTNLGGVLGMNE